MGKTRPVQGIETIVNKAKGEVCKEFEKVCMTDRSFDRIIKEMHDIFDELVQEIKELEAK